MIRIGRPVVYLSVLLTFLVTGGRVWPRACEDRYATQKRQRPVRADGKTLLQMRQQFEQFMSERALQSGADAPNDRPEDKEKLFRQFERWRRERFSS
jgi:hypothetical protein